MAWRTLPSWDGREERVKPRGGKSRSRTRLSSQGGNLLSSPLFTLIASGVLFRMRGRPMMRDPPRERFDPGVTMVSRRHDAGLSLVSTAVRQSVRTGTGRGFRPPAADGVGSCDRQAPTRTRRHEPGFATRLTPASMAASAAPR